MAAVAYYVLQLTIIKRQGENSILAKALGADFKGKLSIVIYLLSILLVIVNPIISQALYAVVAFMWIIPDKRIERVLFEE